MDFVTALIPIVGIVATFLSITIIIYTFFQTRNRERLALLAKDRDSSVWAKKKRRGSNIKFAILMISFGTAAAIGFSLSNWGVFPEEVVILGIIPASLGVGLLVYDRMYGEDYHDDDEV